jgi:hypothetical protein
MNGSLELGLKGTSFLDSRTKDSRYQRVLSGSSELESLA